MKRTPNSIAPVFEPIKVAAKRLKLNKGHLRKLCLHRWLKLGLARQEKHDSKPTWFVRSDATVPKRRKPSGQRRPTPLPTASPTIVIHVAAGGILNITSAGLSGSNPAKEGQ